MRTLGFALVWIGGGIIGFTWGYGLGIHHKLDYTQRQIVAIDFMCNPKQHWKGMKSFCGEQVLDSKGN
jgi:hypothetical protein